jgi:transcription antitermination factor NusG
MATEQMASKVSHAELSQGLALSIDSIEARWYALYVCANHEKRVAAQLCERSIEHFLPIYESVRRWKDRRKLVQLPLFPGYVFVRIRVPNRLEVLRIPSAVRLVGFNGAPTALGDEEVESLRSALTQGVRVEPHPYLTAGRRVRIVAGALLGYEGILIRWKRNSRVVLSVELIQRSIMVDIDTADLQLLPKASRAPTRVQG